SPGFQCEVLGAMQRKVFVIDKAPCPTAWIEQRRSQLHPYAFPEWTTSPTISFARQGALLQHSGTAIAKMHRNVGDGVYLGEGATNLALNGSIRNDSGTLRRTASPDRGLSRQN